MTPQDDLTAERADLKEIARKLVLQINEITPAQWDKQDDKDQAIIIAALKTARQEALREAARHFRGEIMDPDRKEYLEGYNAALRHASAWLELDADRLASEGA